MIVATFLLKWLAFSGLIVASGTMSTCEPLFHIGYGNALKQSTDGPTRLTILVSKLPRMEAHLCVPNNSYLIFVRNFQKKNEPERRSGF